jgi:hypothetical protein
MGSHVRLVVQALRARQSEIEEAIFARVREVTSDPAGDGDAEYVMGLRAAIATALDYCFMGIEHGGSWSGSVPAQAVAQAQRAARSGVSLDTVLRRYMVGQAVLMEFILEEADRIAADGEASMLRGISRALSSLLDDLVTAVARAYVGELQRAGRSREQRLLEQVRLMLAGERALGVEIGYELDAEHLGLIARGASAHGELRRVAQCLDRRLLAVACGEETVWGWLGGRRALDMPTLERVLSQSQAGDEISLALGEPARGFEGWRLTHRQAQEALLVALRRPRRFTRYGDVALLAAALRDDTLSRSLIGIYLSPLDDTRDGGSVLRQTLRAYLGAERNVSSAAMALGVARSTVESRLRTIEARLGRTPHSCPAELEVALHLDELSAPASTAAPAVGQACA